MPLCPSSLFSCLQAFISPVPLNAEKLSSVCPVDSEGNPRGWQVILGQLLWKIRLQAGDDPLLFSALGLWQSVHIDDLRRSKDMISDLTALQNLTISQVFSEQPGEGTGELCAGERGSCAPTLATAGTLW